MKFRHAPDRRSLAFVGEDCCVRSFMSDIMEYNPDNTLVAIPLKEVFHMD